MDTSLSMALRQLTQGSLLKLRDAKGRGVAVVSGRLWITQDGDRRDHIVEAGESFRLDRAGLVIVQALTDTRLLHLDPIAARSPVPRFSAATLHEEARRMRSRVIGDLLWRLAAVLRRAWARLRPARRLPRRDDFPGARATATDARVCRSSP